MFGSKDTYNVTLMGTLGEGSISALADLYMPLLGAKSFGLYFSLYGKGAADARETLKDLAEATKLTYGELFEAKKPLEALGLLKTYFAQKEGVRTYAFALYPPFSPRGFFANVLLSGLLQKTIGEEAYAALAARNMEKKSPEDMKDVSTTFLDYFHPDFERNAVATFSAIDDSPAHIDLGFDVSAFQEGFGKLGYEAKALGQNELDYIACMGALYGYPSERLGEFAGRNFILGNAYGSRLKRSEFASICRKYSSMGVLKLSSTLSDAKGDSLLAQKIRLMDECVPAKWLSIKQGNRKPADPDLRLLEKLAYETGLPGGVINALVDYVLTINHNRLTAGLTEKIGAELVRAGITNARDAMEYLNAQQRSIKKSKGPSKKPVEPVAEPDEETISDEELDAMLAKLEKKGK